MAQETQTQIEKEKIEKILEPIMYPKYEELLVIPRQAIVPVIQKLFMAPYKIYKEFKKFYNNKDKVILFISKDLLGEKLGKQVEAVIKIDRREFALFFMARTSRKIYKYVFTLAEGERIFPASLDFYSTKNAEYIDLYDDELYYTSVDERILRRIFGLKIKLGAISQDGDKIKVQLREHENLDLWLTEEEENVWRTVIEGVYVIYSDDQAYLLIERDLLN